jgi:hypothetical protein
MGCKTYQPQSELANVARCWFDVFALLADLPALAALRKQDSVPAISLGK